MKNQAKKMTKAQKQYAKDHKKPKRKVAKRKTAPKSTKRQGRTIVAKNTNPERRAPYTVVMEERFEDISKAKRPTSNNLHKKAQNLTKNAQKTSKTPQKRQNGQAQRQIKVINIRI